MEYIFQTILPAPPYTAPPRPLLGGHSRRLSLRVGVPLSPSGKTSLRNILLAISEATRDVYPTYGENHTSWKTHNGPANKTQTDKLIMKAGVGHS